MAEKAAKLRTYHVYHINCDCGSYDTTRFRRPIGGFSILRCDLCKKPLGWMEVTCYGSFKTAGEKEAIRLGREAELDRMRERDRTREQRLGKKGR